MHRLQLPTARKPTALGRLRHALALLLTIALATLALVGWRVYAASARLRADLQAVEVLGTLPRAEAAAAAPRLLSATRQSLGELRAAVTPLLPLADRLGWLPIYGADLRSLRPLLQLAGSTTAAAEEAATLGSLLAANEGGEAPLALAQRLVGSRSRLEAAGQHLAAARLARSQIPAEQLAPTLQGYLARADRVLPAMRAGVDLALAAAVTADTLIPLLQERHAGVTLVAQLSAAQQELRDAQAAIARARASWQAVPQASLPAALQRQAATIEQGLTLGDDAVALALAAPWLLGANEPRSYLLLVQNTDEARATGGFLSGVGHLTLDSGAIRQFDFMDSVDVDKVVSVPLGPPPAPLQHYMGSELWLFRDANWSPDLRMAAGIASSMYLRGQGRLAENIVAIDPHGARLILEATGPILIPGHDEPLSAANLLTELRTSGRQQLMADLAQALLRRLAAGEPLDQERLGRALLNALDHRHLQVVVTDEAAAPVFARRGWDGAVRSGTADFLMVVDTDVGFTKVGPNMSQEAAYTVDLRNPTQPQASLTLRYRNNSSGPAQCIQWDTSKRRYDQLMQRCFWNYLRVLTPWGSRLVEGQAPPTPGDWMLSGQGDDGRVAQQPGDRGTTELHTFFVVPQDAERTVMLHYLLPPAVVRHEGTVAHYQLRVQKQAGKIATPTTVRLLLTSGASVLTSTPHQADSEGLAFALDLTQDQTIDISWQQP